MRACFLGQNVCKLGYGVATLQAPRLVMDTPARSLDHTEESAGPEGVGKLPEALIGSRPVANPQRLEV
jgi:hypothetical protein